MANRNLDRVLATDYLDGLSGWPIETIRERRAECQRLEDAASYLRRLVQTRIDLLGHETRLRQGVNHGTADIVEQLKSVLIDEREKHSTNGRLVTLELGEDQESWAHRRVSEASSGHEIEGASDFSDDQIASLTEALVELEHSVSAERRSLHDIFDQLQAELIDRYKSGRATVDGLLR